MIYTSDTKKAINIMYSAHKEQVDKAGLPYVLHPLHLAEQMSSEDECVVALLHDVVEDTNVTFKDLIEYGFNEEVLEALVLLTHDKDVPYYDYIVDISKNNLARKVKIADLEHNMDLSRLDNITEKDIDRSRKYDYCLKYLRRVELIDSLNSKSRVVS